MFTASLPAKHSLIASKQTNINHLCVWLFYNVIGATAQCPYNWGVGSAFHCMKIHIQNDIRDVFSIADFIDSRLSNFDFTILDFSLLSFLILDFSILNFLILDFLILEIRYHDNFVKIL